MIDLVAKPTDILPGTLDLLILAEPWNSDRCTASASPTASNR